MSEKIKNRLHKINFYVGRLPETEQQKLLVSLRKKALKLEASQVDFEQKKSEKPYLSMDEIVKLQYNSRKERYEKQ